MEAAIFLGRTAFRVGRRIEFLTDASEVLPVMWPRQALRTSHIVINMNNPTWCYVWDYCQHRQDHVLVRHYLQVNTGATSGVLTY